MCRVCPRNYLVEAHGLNRKEANLLQASHHAVLTPVIIGVTERRAISSRVSASVAS